jgi:hypothetical protein
MRIGRARTAWILGVAGVGGAMALAAALPARGVEPPKASPQQNLQGTWELNPELTAQLKKEESRPAPSSSGDSGIGGGGRHGGGGGGGFGRGGRGGGGGRSQGSSAGRESKDDDLVESTARLVIAQREGQVTFTDPGGQARILKVGGDKIRDENAPGGPARLQAKWDQDGSLLVEVDPDKGPHRSESYLVSNDHKHLYVTTTVSRRFSGSKEVVRAYDLVPEPAAPPAPAPAAPPPP